MRLAAALALSLALLAASAGSAHAAYVPRMHGFTLADWSSGGYEPEQTARAIRGLRRRHVDALTIVVVWEQQDRRSTDIRPGAITVPTANLVAAIREARRKGMRVLLRPYVDPLDGWRGFIDPADEDAWFASYRRFLLKFATLARRERASGFVVGSELTQMSRYDSHWEALVKQVRRRFRGFVAYQANWNGEAARDWWRTLDAISLSAYYPLTSGIAPSDEQLRQGWSPWVPRIHGLYERFGKPVIFGEIGYRTVPGTAERPWDIDFKGPYDTSEQAAAYEAALAVWDGAPWMRGAFWWYASPRPETVTLPGGDHQPARPALDVVGRWYGR